MNLVSDELSRQSDIYQVGITIYRMVNGNRIWHEQLKLYSIDNIKVGRFPDRKRYLPHVPLKIRKIINKCLEIDIEKRYSNVIDILNDLSLVECTANWLYKVDEDKNEIWRLEEQNKITTICLSKEDKHCSLKTIKANKSTGRETRVVNMCKNNITEKEAYKLIVDFTK